jgi:hypothetical protein
MATDVIAVLFTGMGVNRRRLEEEGAKCIFLFVYTNKKNARENI